MEALIYKEVWKDEDRRRKTKEEHVKKRKEKELCPKILPQLFKLTWRDF